MPKQEKYIQVGVTALRDPATGEFLPAVPLYIKAEDGAEEAEEKLIEDIGKLMAERIRRYKAACKAANVSI
ncbi:MAG: hypothetical protein ACLT1X_10335 [Christensenellales bacterium]|jgi:hypothetical protein|nr:MAG TPA: hypothetical protein [Caudoviricetes sp.]